MSEATKAQVTKKIVKKCLKTQTSKRQQETKRTVSENCPKMSQRLLNYVREMVSTKVLPILTTYMALQKALYSSRNKIKKEPVTIFSHPDLFLVWSCRI